MKLEGVPDGHSILTGGDDGRARFWDRATGMGRDLELPHPGPVTVASP
jgi:WD40 repeat protein